jgi:hypothetical protein
MIDSPDRQPVVRMLKAPPRACGARPAKGNVLLPFAPIPRRWGHGAVSVLGLMAFLLGTLVGHAQTSMSEYQVKALFLLNFVKYVDWPAAISPDTKAPIVIGILGQDNFNNSLRDAAEGKEINGRAITIRHVSSTDDLSGCSVLFVSSSENNRLDAILGKTSILPILTVGEDEEFLQKGGIINFVLKNGKIGLEINLKVAQQVKLQISSKLLSVAEVVKE